MYGEVVQNCKRIFFGWLDSPPIGPNGGSGGLLPEPVKWAAQNSKIRIPRPKILWNAYLMLGGPNSFTIKIDSPRTGPKSKNRDFSLLESEFDDKIYYGLYLFFTVRFIFAICYPLEVSPGGTTVQNPWKTTISHPKTPFWPPIRLPRCLLPNLLSKLGGAVHTFQTPPMHRFRVIYKIIF